MLVNSTIPALKKLRKPQSVIHDVLGQIDGGLIVTMHGRCTPL
jgi:hypothetical protein